MDGCFLTEVINSCFYDSQIYIIHVIILSVCYFLFVYPVLVLLSVFLFNVPACVSLCLAFPFQFSALITAWFSLRTPYHPSLHVCLFLVCLSLCQVVVGYPTFSLAYSFLILRHFFPAISVQCFASFNLSDFLTSLKCTLVLCLSLGWKISSTRLIIFMYFSITYLLVTADCFIITNQR